jgi:hypothetical protein
MAWVIGPKDRSRRDERVFLVLFNQFRIDATIALVDFGLFFAGDDISHLTWEEARAIRHAINVRVQQHWYYASVGLQLPALDVSKPYVERVFDICKARPELTQAHYPWLNR